MTFKYSDTEQMTDFMNFILQEIQNAYRHGFCYGRSCYEKYYKMLTDENEVLFYFPVRYRKRMTKKWIFS